MDLTKTLKDNNITKARLAKLMDVTWNTVHNWCLSPKKLSLEKIDKINEVINDES